jgi:hypothetical protein
MPETARPARSSSLWREGDETESPNFALCLWAQNRVSQKAAERSGHLKPGQTVIEATSGNTGIGLAMVCAQKGYPLVITMAESFSVERRKLMRFLGARVVLTPAAQRAVGMVVKAAELAETHGWFLTRQFENEANPDIHSRTTAREIIADFAGERLDYWVTGYGTGGTLKGVARVLAKERPDTKIIVCEPQDGPLLESGIPLQRNSDGSAASAHPAFNPHPMQGLDSRFHSEADRGRGRHERHKPHNPGRKCRCAALQPRFGAERRDICRHYCGRDICWRSADLCGGAKGRERALHAAGHRRTLSEYAAVCGRSHRYERRGNCNFAFNADRPNCRLSRSGHIALLC